MTRSLSTTVKADLGRPLVKTGNAGTRLRTNPPRAGAQTKSVRISVPVKSARIILKPNSTVDDAIAVVVAACRDHWQANLSSAIAGHPEGTHQVRVALRRMRSALSAFKKHIPAVQREALNVEAKWLLTQLGPARDLDVFIDSLAAPIAERASENADVAQVKRAARAAQSGAHDAAGKALQSPRTRRFAARIDAWVSGRGWRAAQPGHPAKDCRTISAADFAQCFLNRRLRNIRSDYSDIEQLTVNARHDLRIAVKKTRYGLEFFHALLPAKRAARLNELLKHLQDSLGHLNDIEVAERTIGTLVNGAASGRQRCRAGNRQFLAQIEESPRLLKADRFQYE